MWLDWLGEGASLEFSEQGFLPSFLPFSPVTANLTCKHKWLSNYLTGKLENFHLAGLIVRA